MTDATQQFAKNLRLARERARLSQQRVGELCRVHRTEISLLERAARDPQLSTIVRLARCLGVRPATLLDDAVRGMGAAQGGGATEDPMRGLPDQRRLQPLDQFAANLRRYRRRSGLSQQTLGGRCGLHRAEISRLERGEREPRLSTVVRLADCLGVHPAALLERIP